MVDPEGPMSAGRRGALGVANSRGDSRPGGEVWKRERGDLLRPAECPWHPGRSREAGGRLVEVGYRGRQGRQLPLPGCGGQYGGGYGAGRAIPVTCRVVFGAVGAPCGGGNAAVKDWFEISPFGAGWVGAAVLCFGMGASAEGAYSGVLAVRLNVAESPAVITLLGGGQRVGSLDNIVATKDRDSGEVG